MRQVVDWIGAAVSGDVSAVAHLADLPQTDLVNAASQMKSLVVTPEAVLRALEGFRRGQISAGDLHRWTWFVMRGYVPGKSDGPLKVLEIDFQQDADNQIAETLSRLSELGDKVDGALDSAELDELARRLGAR